MAKKKSTTYVKHEDVMRKNMRNPAFRSAYEERKMVHQVALTVRGLRERAGLTQAQLAKKMGMSQPAIGRIERSIGYRAPSWETLRRVFKALGYQMKLSLREKDDEQHMIEIDGRPLQVGHEIADRAP